MPHGTYPEELSVMVSLSLHHLSSIWEGTTAASPAWQHPNAQHHASSYGHRAPMSPATQALPSCITCSEKNQNIYHHSFYLSPTQPPATASFLMCPPTPSPSSLGIGPAPAIETHDSFVVCISQMTSGQHSWLLFIFLFFMFVFCFCHPILVFKGSHCACL